MGLNAPSPPDANAGLASGTQVAEKQQGFNTGAQAASNYNESNPYGSLSYTQTGTGPNGVPIYTANEKLSSTQQGLFDQFMGTKGTAGQQAGSLLSGANYGATSPTDAIGNMTSGLEGQMMRSYQAGNDPMQQTAREQLDTHLKNQGLQPGEPGYDNAMRGLVTSQTLGNDTANAGFAKDAFGQAASLYGMPLGMATQLGSWGSPTTPNSSFVKGAQMQPADLTRAVSNQNQMLQQQYENQMGQYSGMMNGLFGIGSDVLGSMGGMGGAGAGAAGAGMDAAGFATLAETLGPAMFL